MRDRLEYILYSLLGWFVRSMAWHNVSRFGRLFSDFIYLILPLRRRLTLDNLRRAFPHESEAEIRSLARATYRNVVISLLEIFWFPRLSAEMVKRIVSMPDTGMIDAKLKEGKGLIMLGGHFGNWELTAIAVGLMGQHQLTIIVQRQRNKLVDAFMNKNRALFGNKLIEMERSPREIFSALRKNEVVAMLGDQSGPQEGLFVDYFGRPASTHRGPAVFSVRTGAPIIMAFMIRQGNGRYKIELEEVDTKPGEGTEEEKVNEITRRHVAMLEKYVTKYPDHWLWMHKRWKHAYPQQSVSAERVNETTA